MRKRTTLRPIAPHKTPAFISYSHLDRHFGAQAKAVLEAFGFETFLAHEDLQISAEWRERVLEELRQCILFVPLLSKSFVGSEWAAQEIGFVVSRPEVVIAPVSLDDTTPFGFISHLQSRRITAEGITQKLLVEPLARKLPRQLLPVLIYTSAESPTFRAAEENMRPLVPLFKLFTPEEAQILASAAVENGQIWSAQLCRDEFLPEFIRLQSHNIKPTTLRALQYQIEHDSWYSESSPSTGDE